jgi:RHS repeat-associated protein
VTVLATILPGLGIDEFLMRTDVVAGVTSNFLTDALGSPVAVTDETGSVQTEYTYEPFGRTAFTGASNSSSYQYTGRENDGTGLYYYRARYYHPELQRFISEDPLNLATARVFKQIIGSSDPVCSALQKDSQRLNPYTYVRNRPLNSLDPTGLTHGCAGNFGCNLVYIFACFKACAPFWGFGPINGLACDLICAAYATIACNLASPCGPDGADTNTDNWFEPPVEPPLPPEPPSPPNGGSKTDGGT